MVLWVNPSLITGEGFINTLHLEVPSVGLGTLRLSMVNEHYHSLQRPSPLYITSIIEAQYPASSLPQCW